MNISEITIPAVDEFELAATHFEAAAERANGRMVLINSATGVKRGYYAAYARHLCESGFTVLTYDYRGIGGSRPERLGGFDCRMREWGEKDMAGAIDWLCDRHPDRRLLAVGHSVGGQVFGLCHKNDRVAAMLLIGSQSGNLWLFDPPRKYGMFVLMYGLIPVVSRVMGYFPSAKLGLGEDLPGGVAREWARWCRTRDYLYGDTRLSSRENFHRFESPIRAYVFSDDDFAPRRTTEALLAFYPNAPSEIEFVEPSDVGVAKIGHFGFFRETFRDSLWPATINWLAER